MIAYLIKSGALLTLFYLFFVLFMRKTTFFRFNRIALLSGTVICMILPLVDISALEAATEGYVPRIVLPETTVGGKVIEDSVPIGFGFIAVTIYFAGAAAVLVTMVISLFRTLAIMNEGEKMPMGSIRLTIADKPEISFSFFNHIVISREDFENNPAILRHETMHVNSRHSLDVMLFSVITVLQWLNPVVWLVRTELKQIHEYEADEAVIKSGIDATQYQLLLVKKAVGAERFQMANGFNHTKLKNRIMMMQKIKSNKLTRLAYIACLPLLLGTLCFCSGNNSRNAKAIDGAKYIEGEPAAITCDIDTAPKFNGGGSDVFDEWVSSQLRYPQECIEKEIQGRVVVTFCIDIDGSLTDARIEESVCKELDGEVLRVLNSSPKWTPATSKGKNVKVEACMPFEFALK